MCPTACGFEWTGYALQGLASGRFYLFSNKGQHSIHPRSMERGAEMTAHEHVHLCSHAADAK